MFRLPTQSSIIIKMRQQIEADMRAGIVPRTVSSFSELHDYVDANCYGGLCEDDLFDALIAKYGGYDEHSGMPQGMLGMINECQKAIDDMLFEGVILRRLG